jgi:arylsulfatase A-like enzyme
MTKKRNLLLIVMDATRTDHLSAYGYHHPTTPNLARLAEDGVLFENAFAPAPWTPPSHASLFTGTYPSRHGVDVNENLMLNEGAPTLAERLSRHGYRTFAVLPDVHLSSIRRFHRGFQEYVETWRIPYLRLEREWLAGLARNLIVGRDKLSFYTNRIIRRWLDHNLDGRQPFFVFANFKTAHNPYLPPRPFKRRFEIRPAGVDLGRARRYSRAGGYTYMARQLAMGEKEFALVRSWYAGAIAYLDARVGELVDWLKARRLYDETLIIVTADHGENFGEHHLAFHLFCLYDTLIRVPLIMSCPALLPGNRRVSHLVSLVDVVPTVLELLGLDDFVADLDGVSLARFDDDFPYHDAVFSEFGRPLYMLKRLHDRFPGYDFSRFDRGLRCIRTTDHKLIVASDGEDELYHLGDDPGETRNLIGDDPVLAADLRSRLEFRLASMEWQRAAGPPPEDDPRVIRTLRDLGYF